MATNAGPDGTLPRVAGAGVALAAAAAVVLVFRRTLATTAELFPDAVPPGPYAIPEHALHLYGLLPLVVLCAAVLWFAPGILLLLAAGRGEGTAVLTLHAFAVSFLVHAATFSCGKLVLGGAATADAFTAAALLGGGATWLVWAIRGGPAGALVSPGERRRGLWLLAIPPLVVVGLLPILFWQDLNPDGLEALTTGRSLDGHLLPRLPNGSAPGLGLGMVTMAFPVHWLLALFGPVDAVARLPLVFYLPALFAGGLALSELGAPRRLRPAEEAAFVAALAAFTATLAFNDTYHLYSADVASPANIDVLSLVFALGTGFFLWSGRPVAFATFVLLGHLTRPTELLFLLLLGGAAAITGGRDRRRELVWIASAVAGCIATTFLYEQGLLTWGGTGLVEESLGIRGRIRYLRFDDFGRLLYLVVPCGLVPALSLAWIRRHDPLARRLALVTLGNFGFFYALAFVTLHHFALAMVLPVVVLWRTALRESFRPLLTAAAIAGAMVALVLALPRSFAVERSAREIGRSLLYRMGDYEGGYDAYRAAFEHREILHALFRPHWEVADPSAERIGHAWLLVRYSRHRGAPGADTNYVVQPVSEPPPEGFDRVAAGRGAALYVRDRDRWRRDVARIPEMRFRSPLYDIPRETMFRLWGVPAGNYDLDLKSLVPEWLSSWSEAVPSGRSTTRKRPSVAEGSSVQTSRSG